MLTSSSSREGGGGQETKNNNLSTIVATTALISSSVTALISYWYYRRKFLVNNELQKSLDQCQECRKGERQGRIRAEIKLRETVTKLQILERTNNQHSSNGEMGTIEAKESVVTDIDNTIPSSGKNEEDQHCSIKQPSNDDDKLKLQNQTNRSTLTEEDDTLLVSSKQPKIMQTIKPRTFHLKEIGRIVSPFVKRMGTPRQGILAPHSIGYIEFFKDVPSTSLLDGIEEYSHLWILFEFHANTNLHKTHQQRSTKVRPPRAPLGTKVGQLATRSPHRPNALGLSLVQFHKYDSTTRRLYVNALDLVHGTPVYDIKPYVPWDDPRTAYHIFGHDKVDLSSWAQIRVPFWVDQQDTIPMVSWSNDALVLLNKYVIQQNCLTPLYDSSSGSGDDNNNLFKNVKQAIDEIVQQDPRASHTRNASSSTSSNDMNQPSSTAYRILFGTLEIEFDVVDTAAVTETNTTNAAEQKVVKVIGIKYISDISIGFNFSSTSDSFGEDTTSSAVSATAQRQRRNNSKNSTTRTNNYYKSKAEGIPIMGL